MLCSYNVDDNATAGNNDDDGDDADDDNDDDADCSGVMLTAATVTLQIHVTYL